MKYGILEIDHLLTYVANMEDATSRYRRMGFTLTPISHITTMGIMNHLVLLQSGTSGAANFIELMGIEDASKLPAAMQAVLSGEQGIKSMVMTAPDAAKAQAELSQAGYPFAPPAHVKREWVLPGEGSVWPEFDVLLPIPAPLSFNVCQYHNLELYQRKDWQRHPNTALSVQAVFAVAGEPAEGIAYFEKLFGRKARLAPDGSLGVSPAAVELQVYTPAAFEARYGLPPRAPAERGLMSYAGMRVGVADMFALKQCLGDNGVDFADHSGRVVVGPGQACGNVIEFVAERP